MSKQIIIHVPADAQGITVEVNGVTGPSCKKLTEGLENALGKVTAEEQKPEFEMRPAEQEDYLTQ